MTADFSSDVKFEIGHVLFIDIVGYSKGLINELELNAVGTAGTTDWSGPGELMII